MATRTWGSSAITGTYRYDGAKRPISLTIARTGQGQNDLISRTYDLVGNVKSETQTLARSGGSGSPNPTLAYGQTESFTYDAANRVTGSSFDGSVPEARTYTYDADGNRRSVTEAGVTFYYFYDATDALVTKNTTNVAPLDRNPLRRPRLLLRRDGRSHDKLTERPRWLGPRGDHLYVRPRRSPAHHQLRVTGRGELPARCPGSTLESDERGYDYHVCLPWQQRHRELDERGR